MAAWAARRTCPATGLSVAASFADEQTFLSALAGAHRRCSTSRRPGRCTPIARSASRTAAPRCHSSCAGCPSRSAAAPRWCRSFTAARSSPSTRGTAGERLLIDPAHDDGPGDERVSPPVPLGKMGRRLQEIVAQLVEQRPLDQGAALAEAAR